MESVLGVRIKIPPEAVIPLAIGVAALLVLLFFGTRLAAWKARAPDAAARFGLVAAGLLTAAAVFFLLRCVSNQSDPNNEMPGVENISFTDAPIAGFMAALAAVFWRYANQRIVAALIGFGIGVLMLVKTAVWPVMRIWETGERYPRGTMDPEHLMFWGPGVVVVIVTLVAVLRRPRV